MFAFRLKPHRDQFDAGYCMPNVYTYHLLLPMCRSHAFCELQLWVLAGPRGCVSGRCGAGVRVCLLAGCGQLRLGLCCFPIWSFGPAGMMCSGLPFPSFLSLPPSLPFLLPSLPPFLPTVCRSSWARDWTHYSSDGAKSLTHEVTRELPENVFISLLFPKDLGGVDIEI